MASVVRLPRLSNWTDVDALRAEPGVLVRFATTPEELADADLVVLPGTRATVHDLAWLRARGLDRARHIGLEDDVEVLNAFLHALEEDVERDRLRALGKLLPA